MVKKAKLDLLEEKNEDVVADLPSAGEEQVAVASRFFSGKILALMLCAGALLVVVVSAGWMYFRHKTVTVAPAALPQQDAVTAQGKKEVAASFPGFVIHLKDERGNDRTLLCGVALALNDSPEEAKRIEQRVDVRNIVYEVARSKGGDLLALRDERKQFRREIAARVNSLLGTDRVTAVYFTEFVIL
jgi:flagellar basal body-associated protein FliL